MKSIETVEEATKAIKEYQGKAEDFKLPISLKLLDPIGINMAIITDCILEKGWMPDGYLEQNNIRILKYKSS